MFVPRWTKSADFDAGKRGERYVWPPDTDDMGEWTVGYMQGRVDREIGRAGVVIKRPWWRRLLFWRR
jgi:hypothetical protein